MICPLCFSTKEFSRYLYGTRERSKVLVPICMDCNIVYIDGIWRDQIYEMKENERGGLDYHYSYDHVNDEANEIQKRIDNMKGFI